MEFFLSHQPDIFNSYYLKLFYQTLINSHAKALNIMRMKIIFII